MRSPIYTPILKAKAGELRALGTLHTEFRRGLFPLMELPPLPYDFVEESPSKTLEQHISSVLSAIGQHWGSAEAYCETYYLDEGASGSILLEVFAAAREKGLSLVPVTGLSRSDDLQVAVGNTCATDNRGVLIRVVDDDLLDDEPEIDAAIRSLVNLLGVPWDQVDILVDFGEMDDDQRPLVVRTARSLARLMETPKLCRRFIMGGSGFPATIPNMQPWQWYEFPRTEWALWQSLHEQQASLKRVPDFADYGAGPTELAEIDPRLMKISAKIRYTTESSWLIIRSRNVKDHGYPQFKQLCERMIQRPEYEGQGYSQGDGFIGECAMNPEAGPGNATSWVQAAMSHHLVTVVNQLSSYSLP